MTRISLALCLITAASLAFVPSAGFSPPSGLANPLKIFGSSSSQGPYATAAACLERQPRRQRKTHHERNVHLRRRHITELRSKEGSDDVGKRRDFLKQVAAASLLAGYTSLLAGSPQKAGAFCGEPYPYWAYYVDFDEVFVPFTFEGYSGKLFARTVGNLKDQRKAKHNPLVIIPGGPGLPHDYLETLEGASKDDRLVVLFDPIGTGNSTALPANVRSTAPDLLGTQCLIAQTNAVLDYFKLNTFHVFGHGTGAQVALELGKRMGRPSPRPPGPEVEAVLSVILASPVLSGNELPPDFLESLRTPYTRGGNEAPLCLETAMQGINADSFSGGVASLKNSGSIAATGPLSCPVLITYGRQDVVGEKAVANLKEALSRGDSPVEDKLFEESGHLPHLDEREEYVTLVQKYVTFVDTAWAGTTT